MESRRQHCRRLSNLYGFNPSAAIIQKRAKVWESLPALKEYENPLLNQRPGTIMRNIKPLRPHTTWNKKTDARPITAELGDRRPWYGGFGTAGGTASQKIYRYGPQSANNITNTEDPHAVIYQDWAPPFLTHPSELHDPWTPPFRGSPKVWPLEASYVSGSRLKANKKVERESHIESLLTTLNSTKEDVGLLRSTLSTLKDLQRTKYRRTMNRIKKTRARDYDSYGHRKESRFDRVKDIQLKYGRALTVIRATDEDIKLLRSDRRANERMKMKWGEVFLLCKTMKTSSYRKPGFADLESLYIGLLEEIESTTSAHDEGALSYVITRSQFVRATLTKTFGIVKRRNLNRLFSAFDPDLNDVADVRAIGSALRVMWKPTERTMSKLEAIFSLFESEKKDNHATVGDILNILTMCASTASERKGMIRAVEKEYSYVQKDPHRLVHRKDFRKSLKANNWSLLRSFESLFAACLPQHVRAELNRCT